MCAQVPQPPNSSEQGPSVISSPSLYGGAGHTELDGHRDGGLRLPDGDLLCAGCSCKLKIAYWALIVPIGPGRLL